MLCISLKCRRIRRRSSQEPSKIYGLSGDITYSESWFCLPGEI